MIKKIVFFYGPKYNFKRRLPRNRALTRISELAIYSDRKMREHTFKIQSKHSGDAAEKQEERLVIPCLVAYSEQYASISESALHSKLQGQTQFKLNEAENLSAMLGMTMSERDACFFDTQNRYERSLAAAERRKPK